MQSLLINSATSARHTTLKIWYRMKIRLRLHIPYLWVIIPCWLVYRYHRFGGSNYVHLQGSRRRVAARFKSLGVVTLFSAQPVFLVHRGIWKEVTVDFQGAPRGERMWEKSGANDLSLRYPQEALSGAIADLGNMSVPLAAVETLSAYPVYIAALTAGSCVQVSTGCFFVNDHVYSCRLHSFNCEINVIYTYLIQRQS